MLHWYTLPLLLLSLFGLGADNAQARTLVIHMYDDRYEPQNVTIAIGDTVRFENAGSFERWPASNIHPTHRAYPDSDITQCGTDKESVMFDACREIAPGDSYAFTFENAGAWRYHDHLTAKIGGTITVSETEQKTSGFSAWLANIWNYLKALFVDPQAEPSGALSDDTEPVPEPQTVPARNIAADDHSLFVDHEALRAYVVKFGPTAALDQLYAITGSQEMCHDTAHIVGRYAYEEQGAGAFAECDMLCQSGCYHGAVEAYFREHGTTDLSTSMNTLCEGITNSFVLHQCRHGVGHGLMAWSNYQLFDALEGCDLLTDETARRSCYTGVFMENYGQSMARFLEIPGHTTDYLSDDPHFPCNIVADRYRPDCYFLQTDRMLELANYDIATVDRNCREVEDTFSRSMCFRSLGRSVAGRNLGDALQSYQDCSVVLAPSDKQNCLTGVVDNEFWDKTGAQDARILCEIMLQPAEKDMCYQKIFDAARTVMDSVEEQRAFCETIDTTYRPQCILAIVSEQPGTEWDVFRQFR